MTTAIEKANPERKSSVGLQTQDFLYEIWKGEADERERFNKQGNLYRRLVLGDPKTSRCLYWPSRILKVYWEALTALSQVCHKDGLNYTLLPQGCVLEKSPTLCKGRRNIHSKDREGGGRSLQLPGPANGSTSSHILSTTCSSNRRMCHLTCDKITNMAKEHIHV